jgi:hypothetical protein
VIVSVCSDKGSPGVTTLALLLGLLWPGEATVLEGDPSGGDLMLRLRPVSASRQEFLAPQPSVFTLAADIRSGLATGGPLSRYGQATSLGARVIPGPPQAHNSAHLRSLWPAVAAHLAQAPEMVFADLGRLQPAHGAWPLASASGVVLVLARPGAEGLYHLRERTAHLAAELGEHHAGRNPVAAVMLTPAGERRRVVADAAAMLQAAGSPIPVAGWMADDPTAVASLLTGTITKKVSRGPLFGSAAELISTLQRLWPHLAPTPGEGLEHPQGGDRPDRASRESRPAALDAAARRDDRAVHAGHAAGLRARTAVAGPGRGRDAR